ncbi:uncharacterized protein ACNS7B_010030 [Menidia menidia]
MSADESTLLFEGFLQKRKDTLKIIWATYWFRLQNTALFFYTKKNGSALHLRGYYYICSVQSVREVHKSDRRHFMFEITMTNGKRKMLAAETAALRKEWVFNLWQAMHLSTSGVLDSRGALQEVCEERDMVNGSTPPHSHSSRPAEELPAQPPSPPSDHIYTLSTGIDSPICPPEERACEEATFQNLHLPSNNHNRYDLSVCNPQFSSRMGVEEENQNGDYDVLPCRKSVFHDPPTEITEDIYDFPQSYKTSIEHQEPTDSIYDVPRCLMRAMSDQTKVSDAQPEEEIYARF